MLRDMQHVPSPWCSGSYPWPRLDAVSTFDDEDGWMVVIFYSRVVILVPLVQFSKCVFGCCLHGKDCQTRAELEIQMPNLANVF